MNLPTPAEYRAAKRVQAQAAMVRQEIGKLHVAMTGCPDVLTEIWTDATMRMHTTIEAATMRHRAIVEGWD